MNQEIDLDFFSGIKKIVTSHTRMRTIASSLAVYFEREGRKRQKADEAEFYGNVKVNVTVVDKLKCRCMNDDCPMIAICSVVYRHKIWWAIIDKRKLYKLDKKFLLA